MANGSYSGESPDPYGSAAEVPFAAHETFAQGEPDDNQHVGVGPFAGGATRSRPGALLQMSRKKIALRAELEIETARIQEALPSLTEAENAELRAMLASEDSKLDADVTAPQAEAERIAREETAAKHVRPMMVPLSKAASQMVQAKAERRIARGVYLSAETLVTEAGKHAFGARS
jgi:hypothetical protein